MPDMAEAMRLKKKAAAERCHDPYLRCAFYGAAQTAMGISGSCVMAHSPQGCYQLVEIAFGWQSEDYTQTEILCTKLCEDEIVYGGEAALARTILEAKSLKVPAMFVLSACGPEIVGDNISAVCEEMGPKVDFKIIPIECAGFRGSQYDGVDIALDAMLKRLAVDHKRKVPNSVCLIAPHASSNPSWTADLAWVKGVLAKLGANVIATLTHRTALGEFEDVASAEKSIVLSHDAGQKAADHLSREFGVEQLCRGIPLPIGFTNVRRWLAELGKALDAADAAEGMIAAGEGMVVEQCRRKGFDLFSLSRLSTAIVADATIGIPLVRLAAEDLEMVPESISLRSSGKATEELLGNELRDMKLNPRIVYNTDVYKMRRSLAEVRPNTIFGSNIERHAAEGLDGVDYVFQLINPIQRFRMIDREYFGYTGILNLFESVQNDFWDRYRSKRKRYEARW
jgi:nitrogenase molybdenum-iron protein alpha/beta subunit